jgi:drug/metabolite transporter (DMT)-like permease
LTKNRAVLELIFAGGLWGFGFVATIWALQGYTFSEVLCYRFLMAILVGEVIYFFMQGRRFRPPTRTEWKLSLGAGLFLGSLLILQTIGLMYTSATKSGFITSLYVILVPLMSHLFLRKAASLKFYAYVILALFGAALLLNVETSEGLNPGDLWTFACSFAAAFHILYIGRISKKIPDAFRFNNLQSFWCLIMLIPLLGHQAHVNTHFNTIWPWIGIVSLGIGSSVIGFYIQIRAQKVLSPTTASMLFLLESPFALLFGFCLLGERLGPRQMIGAALIMLASYLTVRAEPAQTSPTK